MYVKVEHDGTVLTKVLGFLSLQLKLIWVPGLFLIINTTIQNPELNAVTAFLSESVTVTNVFELYLGCKEINQN